MKDRSHDAAMMEIFREEPTYAAELLNSILEDGDPEELLITLRQIADAHGGFNTVAKEAHLNPTQLSNTLSTKERPVFYDLAAFLRAMGLRLSVMPTMSSLQ